MIVRVTPFIIVLVAAVAAGVLFWSIFSGEAANMFNRRSEQMGAFIRQQQAQGKRILPASGNILRAFTIPFDSVIGMVVRACTGCMYSGRIFHGS